MTRVRRYLRAQLIGALFALAGLLPFGFALWFGERLGWLAFSLLRGERRTVGRFDSRYKGIDLDFEIEMTGFSLAEVDIERPRGRPS